MMKDIIKSSRISILHTILFFKKTEKIFYTFDTVIIVAPHPDDEIIGCSGLIQHLLENKKTVHIVILTAGEGSHEECCSIEKPQLKKARIDLAKKANKLLKLPIENLHFLNYPDGGIAYNHSETKKFKEIIDKINPDVLFIPHEKEGWSDHVKSNIIVQTFMQEKPQISIYAYCVWFWYYNVWKLDWKNAFLLKMNRAEHQLKNRAIDGYIQPKAPCGKPWSGVLPKVFIKANRWNKELYFKIR